MTDRDPFLERITAVLKEPAGLDPRLTDRVMAEVEAGPQTAPAAAPPRWWRRRWTVRLSPLGGLALAAGLTAIVVGTRLIDRGSGGSPVLTTADSLARPTQFVLVAPEASAVTVVGDFNDWSLSATPLTRAEGDGVWWVTLSLPPGRYRYAFVVDGNLWRRDPEAAAVDDEFGRPSSVVTIGGGG